METPKIQTAQTREADFDREFKISAFDLLTDQYLLGKLSLQEVVEAFHQITDDMEYQDGIR